MLSMTHFFNNNYNVQNAKKYDNDNISLTHSPLILLILLLNIKFLLLEARQLQISYGWRKDEQEESGQKNT